MRELAEERERENDIQLSGIEKEEEEKKERNRVPGLRLGGEWRGELRNDM